MHKKTETDKTLIGLQRWDGHGTMHPVVVPPHFCPGVLFYEVTSYVRRSFLTNRQSSLSIFQVFLLYVLLPWPDLWATLPGAAFRGGTVTFGSIRFQDTCRNSK